MSIVPKTAAEAKHLVFLANRILANEGLFDAFGHVSVRNPENPNTFFQSPNCAPEFVVEENMLEIDLDGNVVSKSDKRPYGERFIHSSIYKVRPDVNAVYHGHFCEGIALSASGIEYKPVSHQGAIFYDPVPVFDDYDVSNGTLTRTFEEGARLARKLGNSRGLMMRNHGVVVVGEGVQQMVMGAIFFRDNCRIQMELHRMGVTNYFTVSREIGLVSIKNHITHEGVLERTWNYWLGRARKNMPDV